MSSISASYTDVHFRTGGLYIVFLFILITICCAFIKDVCIFIDPEQGKSLGIGRTGITLL